MKEYFLTTDRLGFSVWDKKDVELALSLWSEADVTRFISATGKFSKLQIKKRLAKEIESDNKFGIQYWPIFEKDTAEFVGCCGIHPYKSTNGVYELGFHIKSKFWGKGYATEAAAAIINYTFEVLKATILVAGHHPSNTKSKRVLEKLGFIYTHDEYYAPTGLQHPTYCRQKAC